VSGPVVRQDVVIEGEPVAAGSPAPSPVVEVIEGRSAEVGGVPVRRVLPRRPRRTVGAWCFADHFGPSDVAEASMQVGPHPHIGLHTVTWVLSGEVLHTDSLGSEQLIRPGQLNLMSAGAGVAHAEQTPARVTGLLHGVLLGVAQPSSSRDGAAACGHHGELPEVELEGAAGTVLVGSFAGAVSPARADTPLVGVELVVRGTVTKPLEPAIEHGVLVTDGRATVDGAEVAPGSLAYLGKGRDELGVSTSGDGAARLMLLGGEPFTEPIAMCWNFVARSREALDAAYRDWESGSGRFGPVRSELARIPAPRPHWRPLS
jgi:redox-sensitive bicupin YhaK (pirin superfamily)